MIRTLIFDLDGTLLDTAPDLATAVNKLLADHGREPLSLDQVIRMIGDGAKMLVERAFTATGGLPVGTDLGSLTEGFLGHYAGHEAVDSQPFPGTHQTLGRFQAEGYAMGVCTNKPQAPTDELLRAYELAAFFGAAVGGDVMGDDKKPSGKHLARVLDRLGVGPTGACMIGDGENDVKTARALGVPVILFRHGYSRTPVEDLGADFVIDGFYALPETILKLADTLPE